MTQYNTLNVKLFYSELHKLKSWIKKWTKVTLNLSSNLMKISNDETDLSHKRLLTDTSLKDLSSFWKWFIRYYIFKNSFV